MNKIEENIMTRRSVRKFTEKQIGDDELKTIIKCGIHAPSALNLQPWQIRVIQNSDILNKINQTFIDWAKGKRLKGSAARASESGFNVFHNALTLIIVACDTENKYAQGDCGMFAQNAVLSAHSLGIGSCVIGCFTEALNDDSAGVKKLLEIDERYNIMFGIALGYPDEHPVPKIREEDRVKWMV